MLGKLLLPMLGGTPAVWNTCLLFFQAALLTGYFYAHLQSKFLKPRHQIYLHFTLLFLSLWFIPVNVPAEWVPPLEGSAPIFWLLSTLITVVGLPFILLSATAPLVQKWYSISNQRDSEDPYFLYSAGNAGSIIAILAYPLALEPHLRLSVQSVVWSFGFVFFIIALGLVAFKCKPDPFYSRDMPIEGDGILNSPSTLSKLHWIALAAAPSALLQSTTTYITTDIAAVPLFWIVPLSVYLLSFILVFSRRQIIPHRYVIRWTPLILLSVVIATFFTHNKSLLVLFPLIILGLFTASMMCHGELYRLRPKPKFLTAFYLYLALGGFMGSFFGAIVAPLMFLDILEFPVSLALIGLLHPSISSERVSHNLALAVCVGIIVLGSVPLAEYWMGSLNDQHRIMAGLALGTLLLSLQSKPFCFQLGLGALIIAGILSAPKYTNVLYSDRTFFGSVKVVADPGMQWNQLVHGTTLHGAQFTDDIRKEPVSYYWHGGPVKDVFDLFANRQAMRVAVLGLGSGTLAAYGKNNDYWDFFEIDPSIIKIARDRKYFTYIADSAGEINIIPGDARLSLRNKNPGEYDLIVVDVFSSDSIPVHLITKEAFQLYLSKLSPDGFILVHLSNRYLELEHVLASIVSHIGLAGYIRVNKVTSAESITHGASNSIWAIIGRNETEIKNLATRDWRKLISSRRKTIWTDDYSNLLECIKLNKEVQ